VRNLYQFHQYDGPLVLDSIKLLTHIKYNKQIDIHGFIDSGKHVAQEIVKLAEA
jgi:hypothetical protein